MAGDQLLSGSDDRSAKLWSLGPMDNTMDSTMDCTMNGLEGHPMFRVHAKLVPAIVNDVVSISKESGLVL